MNYIENDYNMEKIRYVCANCGFIFDSCDSNPICPNCGSNAVDNKYKGEWGI